MKIVRCVWWICFVVAGCSGDHVTQPADPGAATQINHMKSAHNLK
jgi:hypothetical protein